MFGGVYMNDVKFDLTYLCFVVLIGYAILSVLFESIVFDVYKSLIIFGCVFLVDIIKIVIIKIK